MFLKELNMSEKQQHTAIRTHLLMQTRYGDDERAHKHNKSHTPYRLHCRSHPAKIRNGIDGIESVGESTGLIHQLNLRKIRKRLARGEFH